TIAAAVRNMITAVVLAALTNTPYSCVSESSRYTNVDTSSAYTAATTAASVGVNTPNFKPTMTMTGRTSAQVDSFSAWMRSGQVALGGGTMSSLLATRYHVTAMPSPISSPGTMPAKNSLEIDTLAATPK